MSAGDPVALIPLTATDWPAVREIYSAGIATGHATFEGEPPTWDQFDTTRLPDHRLVAVNSAGQVLGWVAATATSDRCVYAGVVEHSIYVAPQAQGQGIGRQLLEAFIESTEDAGIWTIQAGVFPENTVSLALHHAAGFHAVGIRERLGFMGHGPEEGQWRDVVFIERRSQRVGV